MAGNKKKREMENTHMKRIIALLALLAMVLAFSACAKAPAVTYRSDVGMAELSGAVEAYLDAGSLAQMQESYLTGPMKLDTALFADYVVKINAYGANIDEYGIFKAPDAASVDSVKQAVEGYLQLRRDTWMEEYMPEEKPKLTQAEIRVAGQYVMYAIVSDDARKPVLDAFENALKG